MEIIIYSRPPVDLIDKAKATAEVTLETGSTAIFTDYDVTEAHAILSVIDQVTRFLHNRFDIGKLASQ